MATSVLTSIRDAADEMTGSCNQSGPLCSYIDVEKPLKEISLRRLALTLRPAQALSLGIVLSAGLAMGLAAPPRPDQAASVAAGPPPSNGGIFPLSEVHAGLKAIAWTVFTGTKPEPMDVEILGVLRGARGPGHDMILVQLHGAKPEYTGVVAGMSGSPVYIGNRLLGSLSYRIGQFSKDPIAGITPIEQMLEVRDLPMEKQGAGNWEQGLETRDQGLGTREQGPESAAQGAQAGGTPFSAPSQNTMQAMETPLVMGGFHPEAIQLWQKQMAGTGLDGGELLFLDSVKRARQLH